jgi:hypothetical protein
VYEVVFHIDRMGVGLWSGGRSWGCAARLQQGFTYRVSGPISDEVRQALDDRYGPKGWQPAVRPRPPSEPLFLDISYIFKPYIPTPRP